MPNWVCSLHLHFWTQEALWLYLNARHHNEVWGYRRNRGNKNVEHVQISWQLSITGSVPSVGLNHFHPPKKHFLLRVHFCVIRFDTDRFAWNGTKKWSLAEIALLIFNCTVLIISFSTGSLTNPWKKTSNAWKRAKTMAAILKIQQI